MQTEEVRNQYTIESATFVSSSTLKNIFLVLMFCIHLVIYDHH